MKVTVECQGFSASDAIDAHTRHQTEEALRFFDHYVHRADLYLRDVSGPHGPKEYCVVARVSLRNMPPVVVEGNGCDLYLTVRYAARRAQRAVERSVQRYRRFSHTTVRRFKVADASSQPLLQADS